MHFGIKMKASDLGIKRSKVKVTMDQNMLEKLLLEMVSMISRKILDRFSPNLHKLNNSITELI